jgi:formylglycine-generating enzyme required for sulfatase activity
MSKIILLQPISYRLSLLGVAILAVLLISPKGNAQLLGTAHGNVVVQSDAALSGTPVQTTPLQNHAENDGGIANAHTGQEKLDIPQMVIIPPGDFMMGSADYGPSHQVRIGYSFAVGKYPITVGEFARFTSDTGYDVGNQCYTHVGAAHGALTEHSWKNPGFDQSEKNPVVCVNWNDAQAYAAWLSKKTGQGYRLLSEAEYEYVNRAGTTTAYWWGDAVGRNHANCDGCGIDWDGKQSSPVGSFAPNAFGLFDTTGNVWSWTADCWTTTYAGAPADGAAMTVPDCSTRAIRGGAWGHDPKVILSRHGIEPGVRNFCIGFRLARSR